MDESPIRSPTEKQTGNSVANCGLINLGLLTTCHMIFNVLFCFPNALLKVGLYFNRTKVKENNAKSI